MRPIEKPACPNIGGVAKTVTDYHHWKIDLENAIGMFCTYCGMRLNNSPQIEHVVPLNPPTGNPTGNDLAWSNVVFACAPCNGANGKSNKNYNSTMHYMPEIHNTLLPFKINETTAGHIFVEAANGLNPIQQAKANETIGVFNFQNVDTREKKTDYRSSERWQTKKAVDATYENYIMAKASPTYIANRAAINVALQAASSGFFQLWVEAFINEPLVLKQLIDPSFFPGTHQQSFDIISGKPVFRNPQDISDKI